METGLSFTVRLLTADDLQTVAGVEAASFTEPWPLELFRKEFAEPGRVYLAVERGKTLCGFGGVMLLGEDAHIVTLAVIPEERQKGVGSLLMVSLIQAAKERGARNLTLEVRSSNQAAQRLYRKFGFEGVGLRRDYYRTEDALVMWAIDIDSAGYEGTLDEMRTAL